MSYAVSCESQPGGAPRQPVVAYIERPQPPDVLAVLRLTWFEASRPRTVEEFRVYRAECGAAVVRATFDAAREQGFDLTIMSDASWEELGLVDSYET